METTAPQTLLQGCGLPQAGVCPSAWRILSTEFDQGLDFLRTWRSWVADSPQVRQLHYVALCGRACSREELLLAAALFPELLELAQTLSLQWFGLLPGFHRISLQNGSVLLTLCVGEPKAMLREQSFAADSIHLYASESSSAGGAWDKWRIKALSQCCQRGTEIRLIGSSRAEGSSSIDTLAQLLKQAGFEFDRSNNGPKTVREPTLVGRYQPPWTIKTSRRAYRTQALSRGSCAVIGAGLAGASVAAALAQRGWNVTVLDQAQTPAKAASGLPVGLFFPQASSDDGPHSRLSRSGVRLLLQQAHRYLQQGLDWDCSGVLEHRLDRTPRGFTLPTGWGAAGHEWSRLAPELRHAQAWSQGMREDATTLWHAHGGWLKPSRLIESWLHQPGVRFVGGNRITRLQKEQDLWSLWDSSGAMLAQASHVVLANGTGTIDMLAALQSSKALPDFLLHQLPALQQVGGQISWGPQRPRDRACLPPFPVNGGGSLIPSIPWQGGLAWFAGATYDTVATDAKQSGPQHQTNLRKLDDLLPAVARVLSDYFEPDQLGSSLQSWGQTRCVAVDRLPLVGPLQAGKQPTLWISTAMGSRGLSHAPLCAELLAARICGEPWPIEAGLARSIEAARR